MIIELLICEVHLVQELGEEERQMYNGKAAELMEAYKKEVEEYNKTKAAAQQMNTTTTNSVVEKWEKRSSLLILKRTSLMQNDYLLFQDFLIGCFFSHI